MPAIAFGDIDSKVVPAPAWRFYVTMPSIPGMTVDGQVLSFLVQKLIGTHRGVDYEQVPYSGTVRNFPTGFHTDNITVQFIEDHVFDVAQYLQGWLALIIDANGTYGLPVNYKRPIMIDSLDESGAVIGTFGWSNCSPIRPDAYDWDGTQGGFIQASCSFVVDGSVPFSSASGGGSGSGVSTVSTDDLRAHGITPVNDDGTPNTN